jgi:hypothetical protein
MRVLMKSMIVALFFLVTPAVFGQLSDGGDVFNMQGISDGCGATMNADQCMFGDSSWTTTICTMSACPACAFDQTQTRSICYYLPGNAGYCSCAGGSVGRDRYGNRFPNCAAKGSCVANRN